jgi:dCTP deaminase
MVLSDRQIQEALKKKRITIDPVPPADHYNASAVDLRLGRQLFNLRSLDKLQAEAKADAPAGYEPSIEIDLSTLKIVDFLRKYAEEIASYHGYWVLPPQHFALGITEEWVELPRKSKIAGRVEGRSSLARLGLVIHMTAPTIHCGFAGNIVLEMYNFGPYPLRLTPGFNICQLILERVEQRPSEELSSVHMHQTSVVSRAKPSR